jgi:hypothetical protein
LGENAANRDLSELLSGDPERKYRDYVRGQKQRDELHISVNLQAYNGFQSHRSTPHIATVSSDAAVQVAQVAV